MFNMNGKILTVSWKNSIQWFYKYLWPDLRKGSYISKLDESSLLMFLTYYLIRDSAMLGEYSDQI